VPSPSDYNDDVMASEGD